MNGKHTVTKSDYLAGNASGMKTLINGALIICEINGKIVKR